MQPRADGIGFRFHFFAEKTAFLSLEWSIRARLNIVKKRDRASFVYPLGFEWMCPRLTLSLNRGLLA